MLRCHPRVLWDLEFCDLCGSCLLCPCSRSSGVPLLLQEELGLCVCLTLALNLVSVCLTLALNLVSVQRKELS